jgi:predicted metal-binding protein
MCPPNTITPEQFSIALARYSDAILVQWDVRLDQGLMVAIKEGSIDQLQENADYTKFLKRACCDLTEIMNKLERNAMRLGYRFATAFSGGLCGLCDECIGTGHHCRHPFQARPSMEAVGIDVIATAEKATMPIKYPAEHAAALTGLLLID